jgi:hypothetical protein
MNAEMLAPSSRIHSVLRHQLRVLSSGFLDASPYYFLIFFLSFFATNNGGTPLINHFLFRIIAGISYKERPCTYEASDSRLN